MFTAIDTHLLDRFFQRIVDALAARQRMGVQAAPFNMAMSFFIGSAVLLVISCLDDIVLGIHTIWWLLATVPMLITVALRGHMIGQMRRIIGFTRENPLRPALSRTRIIVLVMLLLGFAIMLTRGIYTASALLVFVSLTDYGIGLYFMSCRLPAAPTPSADGAGIVP